MPNDLKEIDMLSSDIRNMLMMFSLFFSGGGEKHDDFWHFRSNKTFVNNAKNTITFIKLELI